MRLPVTVLTAVALSACGVPADTNQAGNETGSAEASQSATNQTAPEALPENVADVPVKSGPGEPDVTEPAGPPPEGADECKASDYQWLVGQPRSKIPETPEGSSWRVACTTCPITMDYSAARMNIFFDEETGIIKEVKCG